MRNWKLKEIETVDQHSGNTETISVWVDEKGCVAGSDTCGILDAINSEQNDLSRLIAQRFTKIGDSIQEL